ncbi:hypothetical protein GF373_09525, partial [bacterium]|nr:hypothetical protein [bacterium]
MKQNRFLRILLNNLLFVVPVAAGICILAVFIVFAQGPQKKPGGETAEHVRVIKAPSVDVVPQAVGYGTVEPTHVWKAVAEVSGDIIQIHPRLDAGELILEPTTLLQIDPAEYKLAVQQFQAQLNQDEARLKELETNLNNYQSLLAIQKEILALSEKELKRKQALLEKGDYSPSAYEQEQRQVASQR